MPESRKSRGSSALKSGWAGGSPAPAVITVPRTENLVPGPASRDPPGKGSGEQTQRHEESCRSERGTSANPPSFRFTCCPGPVASINEIYWGRRGAFTPKRHLSAFWYVELVRFENGPTCRTGKRCVQRCSLQPRALPSSSIPGKVQ